MWSVCLIFGLYCVFRPVSLRPGSREKDVIICPELLKKIGELLSGYPDVDARKASNKNFFFRFERRLCKLC